MRAKTNHRRRFILSAPVILAAVGAAILSGCGSSGSSAPTASSSGPHRGGTLTVLEGASFAGAWPGLDPATDTDGAANQSYMNSIFGELFALGPGGKLIPDLATGYSYGNGDCYRCSHSDAHLDSYGYSDSCRKLNTHCHRHIYPHYHCYGYGHGYGYGHCSKPHRNAD